MSIIIFLVIKVAHLFVPNYVYVFQILKKVFLRFFWLTWSSFAWNSSSPSKTTFKSSTVFQHAFWISLHASAPTKLSFDKFDWIKSATSDDQFLKFTFINYFNWEFVIRKLGAAELQKLQLKRFINLSHFYIKYIYFLYMFCSS